MSSHGDGHNPYVLPHSSYDTALRTARAALNRAMSLEPSIMSLHAAVEASEQRITESNAMTAALEKRVAELERLLAGGGE